jgi:glycosyltransferase involved in cell wall biosynthesis
MKVSPGKILIIVENLPVPFDRRVWLECNALKEAGYQVSVICPIGKGFESLYENINGIHIYRHSLPEEKSSAMGYLREYSVALFQEWRLARKIRITHGFDIIQACNPPDLIFLVALWFKVLYRTRFVFDHHDLNPELYESKFGKRGVFYRLLQVMEFLTFKMADTVISTNESYKQIALTRGRKQPQDVFVVRSGPNLEHFNKVKQVKDYHRGKNYLVGYLGVMGEFDGVEYLIHAADYTIKKLDRVDIQFCFIGSGPMLKSLQELTIQLEIQDNVHFTGRISDEELIRILSSCDVCVNPDPMNPLNAKSTMNKILEYMALERPIVQFDLLEGRRSAGEASLYAKPNEIPELAEKIVQLINDPDMRGRMGSIGRIRMIEELEWRHQIPKLLLAYDHVLSK